MLVRLKRLKASAMTSILKRSPRGMRRERRMSHWKKLGDVKRLRPRFPLQPAGGETSGTWNGVPSLLRHTLAGPKVTPGIDRKSTRLNSSHSQISYAVFCLKKKTKTT